jgi:hypothetical protein
MAVDIVSTFLSFASRTCTDFGSTIAAGRRLGTPERAKRDMAEPA